MESVTPNLHNLLKMNHTAYSCRLRWFPTVLQFAASRSDVVCLITGINSGELFPKSQCCKIQKAHSSTERTSGVVHFKKRLCSYMKVLLNDV